jgi:hypothetical protein
MKVEKHFENRNYSKIQENPIYRGIPQFNKAEEPWTETETKINDVAQANGYEALFQSFSKQNWFAGRYGNGMLMIITRKDIDIPTGKTSFRNTKKWYK